MSKLRYLKILKLIKKMTANVKLLARTRKMWNKCVNKSKTKNFSNQNNSQNSKSHFPIPYK